MSIAGIVEAMRSKELSFATRLVWICLENHANGQRQWRMTSEAIAEELGMSLGSARTAIIDLEKRGIVRREIHARQPPVFHMLRVYSSEKGNANSVHSERAKVVKSDQNDQIADSPVEPMGRKNYDQTEANVPVEGHKACDQSGLFDDKFYDQSTEFGRKICDSLTHPKKIPPERVSDSTPPFERESRVRVPEDVAWIVNAWDRMADQNDLPSVRSMTERRKSKIRERIKQFGRAGVLEAIEKIGASAFCCGKNDRGWKAHFNFLLQESSMQRALEGVYDNRKMSTAIDPSRLTGFARSAYLARQELADLDAAEARARREGAFPMIEGAP